MRKSAGKQREHRTANQTGDISQTEKHYLTLRGGRMTKLAGVVASFAPTLGVLNIGVSALAIGAAVSVTTSDANAQGMPPVCDPAGGFGFLAPANPNGLDGGFLFFTGAVDSHYGFFNGAGIDASKNKAGTTALELAVSGGANVSICAPYENLIAAPDSGIRVFGNPGNDVTITTTGEVSGGTKAGIYTYAGGSGDVNIRAYESSLGKGVFGGDSGIEVFNQNGGNVTITADTVTGAGTSGITVSNFGRSEYGAVTINARKKVSGNYFGIYASNDAAGGIKIDATNPDGTSQVTGYTGISVKSAPSSVGNIQIEADNVTGWVDKAINAEAVADGTKISVTTTGMVSGLQYGIRAIGRDVTINTLGPDGKGNVFSGAGTGISVQRYSSGAGDISITTGRVSAQYDGIAVDSYPNQTKFHNVFDIDVTSRGAVASYGKRGISILSGAHVGKVTIDATNKDGTASVAGVDEGIYVANAGGAVSVDITADNVYNDNNAAIRVGDPRSSSIGDSPGEGISITVNKMIESRFGSGISATSQLGGDILIDVVGDNGDGYVKASFRGIYALNGGDGDVVVKGSSVTTTGGDGIAVANRGLVGGVDVAISKEVTSRGASGVSVENFGADGTKVHITNSDGTAMAKGYQYGLNIRNYGGGVDIIADNVASDSRGGIFVYNGRGSDGDVSITSSGLIEAGGDGITATQRSASDLLISVNDINSRSGTGVFANAGSGMIDIRVDGDISARGSAIVASAHGGDIKIDARHADGKGILAGTYAGIYAYSSSGGISIFADNVTAGKPKKLTYSFGINVEHTYGDGSVHVETTGKVGGGYTGIFVSSYGTGNVTIVANDVSGEDAGITVLRFGSGDGKPNEETVDVSISGRVEGARHGLRISGGNTVRTVFEDGADLAGDFIQSGRGTSETMVMEGAAINANVALGEGSDDFIVKGGSTFGDGVEILGGLLEDDDPDAIDRLIFEDVDGDLPGANADFTAFDHLIFRRAEFEFGEDEVVFDKIALEDNTSFTANADEVLFDTDLLTIDGSSTLGVKAGRMTTLGIAGNVQNNGMISLQDGETGDAILIKDDLSGDGTFAFDAQLGTTDSDKMTVQGNNSANVGLMPNFLPLDGAGEAKDFTVVTVEGENTGSFFFEQPSLEQDGEELVSGGAFLYAIRKDGDDVILSPFAQDEGEDDEEVMLNPVISSLEAMPQQLFLLSDIEGLVDRLNGRIGGPTTQSGGGGGVTQALTDFGTNPDQMVWMKVSGAESSLSPSGAVGTRSDTSVTSFEFGVDLPIYQGSTGTLFGGFSFGYHDASGTFRSAISGGSIQTEAQTYSINTTWLSDDRFFVDASYQRAFFDSDTVTVAGGIPLLTSGTGDGNAASLEVGRMFDVSSSLTVMPSLQVAYNEVSGVPVADPLGSGAVGVITDGETALARVGLNVQKRSGGNTYFGKIGFSHAFDSDTAVNFGGLNFVTNRDENRLELGAGGEISVGANSAVFGTISASGALDDWSSDERYTASAGFRINF